jgi:methylmalonyl-CoA mutase N-terminal domain/subunit
VVGVNKFRLEKEPYKVPIFKPDHRASEILVERIKKLRRERDNAAVTKALKRLEEAVRSDENTMPYLMEAVKAHATPGELAAMQIRAYGPWCYPIAG